ncbi:MAG: imidazoleglycerol-phosphate dehydratase HisB [Elusimicrobiota bacterium]
MSLKRIGKVERKTKETRISAVVELDNVSPLAGRISTSVPFIDHMLTLMSVHGKIGLTIKARGDTDVDNHHIVEDIGIVMGQAFKLALGDKRGITRYGTAVVPMDEALGMVCLDISNRPFIVWDVEFKKNKAAGFDFDLVEEYFRAFAVNSGITLHAKLFYGKNNHHMSEALFKALGRALNTAVSVDPKIKGIPSTKGKL